MVDIFKQTSSDPFSPHLQPLRHFLGRAGALPFWSPENLQNNLHWDFLVICPTCQASRSWLNSLAFLNMRSMLFTELVSQLPMSWLNALALWNMLDMSVTELVSHPPMSWLKALANYRTAKDEWSCGVSGDR